MKRYDLAGLAEPFSRCARCNGMLIPVEKADVFERLEPKTKLYYNDFQCCQNCGQVYWRGSHFERMKSQLQALIERSGSC